jgi:membrane protease YdiL (CAAX protease family)
MAWTESTAPLAMQPFSPVTAESPAPAEAPGVYAPPQGRWGLGDVGWLVLVVVGSLLLGVVAGVVALGLDSEVFTPDGNLDLGIATGAWLAVVSQGIVMAGLAGWPMVAATWKGPGWRRAFGFVASGRALWVGIVGGIATFLTLVVLTAIASAVVGQTIDSAAADLVADMESQTVAYVVFLVFIAFGAPFVEEMAFRGLLWGAIVKRGWSPWVATVVSGVAFGLFHFEPLRLVPLIAAGVVLGVVRHKAGLGAAMLAHCVVNSIGVVSLLAT